MNERKVGAILSYISIIGSTAISLLYTPYMLKVLGANEHGLYSLVNSVVIYFTLMDLGFGNAIIRYSAKFIEQKNKEAEGKLLGMFFVIYLVIGLIVFILGIILTHNVDFIFRRNFTREELEVTKTLLILATVNISISFIFKIFNASIQAHERFIFARLSYLLKHLINPILMIVILLLGYKSIGMMVGVLILNIVFSALEVGYFFRKIKVKLIISFNNLSLLKEISIYSFYIFLNIIVERINWSSDQIILGIFLGPATVSIYAIAAYINTYYRSLATVISSMFLPETTKMVERKASNEEFTETFVKVGRIQFIILSLVLSGFIIFGDRFIILWAGSGYEKSFLIAMLLIIPVTIPLIQDIGITIIQAKNLHKFRSITYLIVAILNIIISIPLVYYFDAIGAAIGTAIAIIIGHIIIMNFYYHIKVKINMIVFWNNLFRMSLGLIVPIISGFYIKSKIPINNYLNLIINILLYFIVFSLSFWLISLNKYEKNLIITPIKKILNKLKRA